MDTILVQCIENEENPRITINHVYEMVTYSNGKLWKTPVIGIVDDTGEYTVYPASYFRIVNIEEVEIYIGNL